MQNAILLLGAIVLHSYRQHDDERASQCADGEFKAVFQTAHHVYYAIS